MKIKLLLICCVVSICLSGNSNAQTTTIKLFDKILFYDGYAQTVTFPVPNGVIRHRNDLYAKKLTDQQLQSIGTTLDLKVVIKASCDNYDRIGSVNMAFVPKGSTTYIPAQVTRLEIARYITPFMNKNIQPDTVPYVYSINNVARILKDIYLLSKYDIWIELEVFGVPYAANTEVAGCSGRNDVFYGSLELITNTAAPGIKVNKIIPLACKADFNNYTAGASDAIGKTTKTINITIDTSLTDASLFLITSNHGANSGGEEYVRRNHYVYFDNKLVHTYKPGRTSCEPFRKYNTQGNGIYGSKPMTDAQWQSFSNWCPGDIISIRKIDLGALTAGNHIFRIEVPDAVFTGKQGNFPFSLYLQGNRAGGTVTINEINSDEVILYPNPINDNTLMIETGHRIKSVHILNALGQVVLKEQQPQIDLSVMSPGVYTVQVFFDNDLFIVKKLIRN